jgi:hypothetical protein
MEDMALEGDDVFNAFLQRMARYMLKRVYAHPYSNFYEVNNHFVLDGVTVGSPVMLTEEDVQNNRRVCTLPHYTESFLMRDWFGEDIAYHRKWKVSNIAAMQAFGKDNLPDATQNEIQQGTLDTKHEYLMCIARAADPIFHGLRPEFQIPLIRPWMQLWFAVDGLSVNEKKPLNYTLLKYGEESARRPDGSTIQMPTSSPGYWHKPFNAWHYNRLPHETYSRTPAWNAMPDVKGLNAAWRTVHETAHRYARPSAIVLESLKGKLRLGAQGVTWVTPEQYDKAPKPFDDRSRYTWAMDFVDRRAKSAGRHFFADQARMIENYSRDHTQPPTAYQLSQMISETLVLIGPGITSYSGPALQNIDEQFIEIEMRSGRLWENTRPPEEILDTNGNISPIFVGPLIQGLRYAMVAKRIEQPLLMAAPIFEMAPDSKVAIRWDDLVEKILEAGDFPQAVIVPKEEREEALAALSAERQQTKMIENMSAMADAVPKLQGDTGENSPLKVIGEAA